MCTWCRKDRAVVMTVNDIWFTAVPWHFGRKERAGNARVLRGGTRTPSAVLFTLREVHRVEKKQLVLHAQSVPLCLFQLQVISLPFPLFSSISTRKNAPLSSSSLPTMNASTSGYTNPLPHTKALKTQSYSTLLCPQVSGYHSGAADDPSLLAHGWNGQTFPRPQRLPDIKAPAPLKMSVRQNFLLQTGLSFNTKMVRNMSFHGRGSSCSSS
jgi:hypothetical protein